MFYTVLCELRLIYKEAKILIDLASYRATTHTNDAQTVHTCQTQSLCKPRPPAYIQGPASIRGNTVIVRSTKPSVRASKFPCHAVRRATSARACSRWTSQETDRSAARPPATIRALYIDRRPRRPHIPPCATFAAIATVRKKRRIRDSRVPTYTWRHAEESLYLAGCYGFYLLSSFFFLLSFSSPILSGRRLDAWYHTSTHGVVL